MPQFTVGGAEKLVLEYAKRLPKEEFEVVVASSVEGGPLLEQFQSIGANVFVASRNEHGGRLGAYRELKKFTKDFQPDIIHSHLFGGDLVASKLVGSLNKKPKWISTTHNIKAQESWLRRFVWKRIMKKADKIIAVGDKVSDFCDEAFRLRDGQKVVIKNGIEVSRWANVLESDFAHDTLRLATIGRLTTQKGHAYLLTALTRYNKAWHLDVFGDGELKQSLKNTAIALGINDNISWHGAVSNPEQYLERIDVVVQPSLWEGLSLVVMEAMAAGKCVLASLPAGEEIIDEGKTGYLVPAGDAGSLALKLREIDENRYAAKDVAVNARQWAREYADLSVHMDKLSNLYREVSK